MIISTFFELVTQPSVFLLLLGISVAFLLRKRIKSKSKPGPNPFEHDWQRPVAPMVLDHKERNAVLKNRFQANKYKSSKYDTIVVGSGAAGLSTAVLLSRIGQRVLVLEQHDQAGGFCHTFMDQGYEFDTGMHYVGCMDPGNDRRRLLDQLTDGQVQWSPMHETYDVVVVEPPAGQESAGSKFIPIKAGFARFKDGLVEQFPDEKWAILKLVELIKEHKDFAYTSFALKFIPLGLIRFLLRLGLHKLVSKRYKANSIGLKPAVQVVETLTTNPELRVCMTYQMLNTGGKPRHCPFALLTILQDHFMHGGYYPVGGSSEVVYHMVRVIQKAGGDVLCSAPVEKILFDEMGKACGVEVGPKDVKVFADRVVSSVGVDITINKLIPRHIAQKSDLEPLTQSGISTSSFYVFLGLDGTCEELGIKPQNYWIMNNVENWAAHADRFFTNMTLEEMMDEDLPLPFVYFSSSTAKDPSCKQRFPGKTSACVLTAFPYSWMEEFNDEKKGRRGERYEEIKNYISRKMWGNVLSHFPQLDGKLVYMNAGTPVTINHYMGKRIGECFGLDATVEKFNAWNQATLRPETGIPGLYVTGVDLTLAGVVPAMLSGVITCSKILGRNLFDDMEALYKKLDEEQKA